MPATNRAAVRIDHFNGAATRDTGILHTLPGVEPIVIGDPILAEGLQGFRNDRDFRRARAALDTLVFEPMTGRDVALTSAATTVRFVREERSPCARPSTYRERPEPGFGFDSEAFRRSANPKDESRRGAGGRPGRRAPRAGDPDCQPLDAADVQPRAFGSFASERDWCGKLHP